MSELIARRIGQLMSETGRCDTEVYIKSEADKVITELKVKLKVQASNAEKAWKLKDSYHTNYAEAVKELYDKNKEIAEKDAENRRLKRALWLAWFTPKKLNQSTTARCAGEN